MKTIPLTALCVVFTFGMIGIGCDDQYGTEQPTMDEPTIDGATQDQSSEEVDVNQEDDVIEDAIDQAPDPATEPLETQQY